MRRVQQAAHMLDYGTRSVVNDPRCSEKWFAFRLLKLSRLSS